MNNRDLATFRMIARTATFREAAERLNMTTSAVSMQMKALEGQLGAALFDRRTRPPAFTPLGLALLDAADAVLEAEARLLSLVSPGTDLAGRFRLGLVASAAPRLLPGFLGRVGDALPDARFDYRTGLSEALEAEVATGTLDAAVVTATGVPPGGLRHRLLAEDRLILAVPASLPADAPFLHFAPSTGIGKLIAAALAERPDLAARPRIVLDHVETIRACLRAGTGATILPEVDLTDMGDLRCMEVGTTRSLVLATRAGTPLDERGDRLAALLTG